MRFIIRLAALMLLELPVAACAQGIGGVPRTARVGDLVYRARLRVFIDSSRAPIPRLQAAVTVTNAGREPVALGSWPNCFFTTLELWPAAGAREAPAWDEEHWRGAYQRATGVIVECDFASGPLEHELAPGESVTFERSASSPWVRDVLGDSLAGGRYRALLRVRPPNVAPDARPSILLDAGEVVLDRNAATGAARMPFRTRPGSVEFTP